MTSRSTLPAELPISVLGADTVLTRLHALRYAPTPQYRQALHRFDDPERGFGICYLAESLSGAFVETFLQEGAGRSQPRSSRIPTPWTGFVIGAATIRTASRWPCSSAHTDSLASGIARFLWQRLRTRLVRCSTATKPRSWMTEMSVNERFVLL